MNQDFLSEGQRALCWAAALSLGHSLTGVGKHPWITGLHPFLGPGALANCSCRPAKADKPVPGASLQRATDRPACTLWLLKTRWSV